MAIEPLVDTIINLINLNFVARTNVVSNVSTGDVTIQVENSFHFQPNQEIIIIDNGYNVEGDPHYQIFEYAKVKSVSNTTSIVLTDPVVGNWLVTNQSFIQKTIGHSPLYENEIYYGDREVISTDQMSVTVEPVSMSNEWMYLQGGLNEEYKLKIMIYGKDVKFEEGRRILDRYSDNMVQLLNQNIHIGVEGYSTPLVANVASGETTVYIEDNAKNEANILKSIDVTPLGKNLTRVYQLQDNNGVTLWFGITDIQISGGQMILTIDAPASKDFLKSEYAVIKRFGIYMYDSRADNATYGVVSKGSAMLRASEISWFGKTINEFTFPQKAYDLNTFTKIP